MSAATVARPPRVALVLKRSAWDRLMARPDGRMRELMRRADPTVAKVKASHTSHVETVAEVKRALAEAGVRYCVVPRTRAGFDATAFDLVVTVGGDGTLLYASHSVGDQPVLAVNSAPQHSVGFFCGARKGRVREAVASALRGQSKRVLLTRMRVALGGRTVSSRVLNDALFCHVSPAATTRYIIELDGLVEEHKSSGFWIGPAAGSTAAQRSAGGKVLPLGSRELQLVVREPYTPLGEQYQLWRAMVQPGHVLRVRSKCHEARLFLDGADNEVRVALGDVVELSESGEPLTLLGTPARRRWRR
ncbi:MAG: NAD(+)/NADH kinase [Deltaproteobacteria bacterium]|nr:NAD(+)/NADH kinase [Deltaproteobacteria bacterium]